MPSGEPQPVLVPVPGLPPPTQCPDPARLDPRADQSFQSLLFLAVERRQMHSQRYTSFPRRAWEREPRRSASRAEARRGLGKRTGGPTRDAERGPRAFPRRAWEREVVKQGRGLRPWLRIRRPERGSNPPILKVLLRLGDKRADYHGLLY